MDVSKAGAICIIYGVYVGFCWPVDLKEERLFLACSLESCLFRSQQNCKNKQFIIYFVNWFLAVINPSLGSSEPQQSFPEQEITEKYKISAVKHWIWEVGIPKQQRSKVLELKYLK